MPVLLVAGSVFDLVTEVARREGERAVERCVVALDGHDADVAGVLPAG